MEMAARIAGSFRPGDEDMRAELFSRLAEIKARPRAAICNWQAYLAQSLYNAAKNVIRREDALRQRASFVSMDDDPGEDRASGLDRKLRARADSIESHLDLEKVWAALTPEMRDLAQLLFEEEGNISSLAKRLRRPRKTVEYWVGKLRAALKRNGIA